MAEKAPRTRHVDARGTIGQSVKSRAVRSKYGVRHDAAGKLARTVDGKLFASQAEARRFSELKLLEKAGEVQELELQPVFPLHAKSGGVIGIYRADFRYCDRGWNIVIEDVKGKATALYLWKKKHFETQYGVTVTEIRYRR